MYITQGLHRSARSSPDAVATVCGQRTRTVAEQADRVARLAGGLRSLGVEPGHRVAILGANSDRYLETLLGVAWAGAVFAPLNNRWSAGEIAYAVNDSGSEVLVVGDGLDPALVSLRERCPRLREVVHFGEDEKPAGTLSFEDLVGSAAPLDDARRGGDELAGLFYTGGTTGLPKGVMISHANLMVSALGTLASGEFLTPGGKVLHVAPLFHLAGIWPWLAQLLLGGAHVVLPGFDPEAVVTEVVDHEVTDMLLVPTMVQGVVDLLERSGTAVPSLRRLIYAGSPISEALVGRTRAAIPGIQLLQGYGMTELAPVATLLRPEEHHGPQLRSGGRAAPHAEVRIVDEDDREVPQGEVGEIAVRGGQVMLGYWNMPEQTAAALRDGWMHTGDLGHMDGEGFVYIVDRLKDMIISGGENIYSAEVENALGSHPAVAACAVVGVADAEWGERVHAVVALKPDATVSAQEIREHCATAIARYKAPRSVEFVEALPVSAAGKVLKRELRKQGTDSTDGPAS